ncbi:GGDEF domain protein [hydrothermal vent metagenome]|uniref:GGDEF domain protein n=1 Tax=hydrothermal vent metagenome TaxID=652676 RepID=A0A3B0ZQ53_9ZZZZ
MTKFNSLAFKFFIFIAIILIIAMSISTYSQYRNEANIINKALYDRGESLAELLAAISVEPLLVFDDVTLNGYAEFVSNQKNIVFAAVVNEKNIPLTHYLNKNNDYIQSILKSKEIIDIQPVLEKLRGNTNILFFEMHIEFGGNNLAKAWVGLDRLPYNQLSKNSLLEIMWVTLGIGLFVGGAIYLLFKRKIFKPIAVLTQGTRSIANFNFDTRVKIEGSDEFALLADSFDKMRLHIRDTMESRDIAMVKLSELNESLEERVHERTQELQILNLKIAHEAMHDPLTGLPNRVLVTEQLQHDIALAERTKTKLAVFIMDLNNFKEVNDTLGHPEGDRLLINVAQRLLKAIRESDTVGRLGGDEFAMVLPDINEEDAIKVANKILEELLPSFALDDHTLKVGASIGIAMYPDHGIDHTSLVRLADVAMYEAKKDKSDVCVYRAELDKYTPLRLSLMDYLHTALETNQLQLHYQPQISLAENKVVSVEALIRWYHPELGWIFPDQFIPIAENTGLINQVSDWVLEQAFMQWRKWQDKGMDLQIAVNLSARDLANPNLPVRIAELCKKYRMYSNGIKAEITESAIMYNPEQVIEIMKEPDVQRLQFSIDDFGTGYSSLSYLKRLSVEEVKIDKSFITDMVKDDSDASIVKSVIDLVHNLGRVVVAEGVEDIETLTQLKLLGCDKVQGYYFSKAVPVNELLSVIKKIEQF